MDRVRVTLRLPFKLYRRMLEESEGEEGKEGISFAELIEKLYAKLDQRQYNRRHNARKKEQLELDL
jgi:hypothetical protein